MNKLITSSVLVGVLSVSSLALAENSNIPTPTHVPVSSSVRKQMKEQKDQLLKNAKDTRSVLKNTAQISREDVQKQREEFNESIKKQREEFKDTVEAKREKLKDEIETKREELKTRLEKIKDARKKETVERIDARIDALNEKMMKHFSDVLDKLGEMLIRIGERADKATTERNLDVTAVRLAMEKANTAIASARSAIETQSGKTYSIKITTEDALRVDVGKTRKTFGDDLVKVKDAVREAHSAVKDAAVALAQLVIKPKVSPSPSVSPTATPVE